MSSEPNQQSSVANLLPGRIARIMTIQCLYSMYHNHGQKIEDVVDGIISLGDDFLGLTNDDSLTMKTHNAVSKEDSNPEEVDAIDLPAVTSHKKHNNVRGPTLADKKINMYEFKAEIMANIRDIKLKNIEVDSIINSLLEKTWRVERLGVLMLCILRVAIYDVLYLKKFDIPFLINEYIEIAKRFNHAGEAGFVNKILDMAVRNEFKS